MMAGIFAFTPKDSQLYNINFYTNKLPGKVVLNINKVILKSAVYLTFAKYFLNKIYAQKNRN